VSNGNGGGNEGVGSWNARSGSSGGTARPSTSSSNSTGASRPIGGSSSLDRSTEGMGSLGLGMRSTTMTSPMIGPGGLPGSTPQSRRESGSAGFGADGVYDDARRVTKVGASTLGIGEPCQVHWRRKENFYARPS
jgi:hypothetical protein